MRKPAFAYAKTKAQISFAVPAKLISAFVFATRIVQSLYFLNPKFQASSHLLLLYSPVHVGPGRKSRKTVVSQRGSYNTHIHKVKTTPHITITCPCNILQFITAVKTITFRGKILILFLFMLTNIDRGYTWVYVRTASLMRL